MGDVYLRAARLDVVLEGPAATLARVAAMPAEDLAEVSPVWLERVRGLTAPDPWLLGFALVDRAGGVVVGSAGFKGPPDADGVVEVAYGIDPDYRGRGYATEAAAALTAFALAADTVRRVIAHTKSDNDASARVLTKCGFARIGPVTDPEDGLVTRWERAGERTQEPTRYPRS